MVFFCVLLRSFAYGLLLYISFGRSFRKKYSIRYYLIIMNTRKENKNSEIVLVDIPEGQIVLKYKPTIKDTLSWQEYQDHNKKK